MAKGNQTPRGHKPVKDKDKRMRQNPGLHPLDDKEQYRSPKPTSKRRRLFA